MIDPENIYRYEHRHPSPEQRFANREKEWTGKIIGDIEVTGVYKVDHKEGVWYKVKCLKCGWTGVLRSDGVMRGRMRKCGCWQLQPGEVVADYTCVAQIYKFNRRYYIFRSNIDGTIKEARLDTVKTLYAKRQQAIAKEHGAAFNEFLEENRYFIGKRYGQLKVIELNAYNPKTSISTWKCECSCLDDEKRMIIVDKADLISGTIRRCETCDRMARLGIEDPSINEKPVTPALRNIYRRPIAIYDEEGRRIY